MQVHTNSCPSKIVSPTTSTTLLFDRGLLNRGFFHAFSNSSLPNDGCLTRFLGPFFLSPAQIIIPAVAHMTAETLRSKLLHSSYGGCFKFVCICQCLVGKRFFLLRIISTTPLLCSGEQGQNYEKTCI